MRRTLLATTAAASMLAFAAGAQQATDPAASATAPAAGTPSATAPMPMLHPALPGEISADALIGATIQTLDGGNIAEVKDVLVGADGTSESIVAEFGGFLGFGSNTVLLTMGEVEVMKDDAGNLVVQTALTPESLEGRPDYQAEN
jgi:PRC-barrel domain